MLKEMRRSMIGLIIAEGQIEGREKQQNNTKAKLKVMGVKIKVLNQDYL